MLSTYSQPLIITFYQNICLKESKKDVSKVTQDDRVATLQYKWKPLVTTYRKYYSASFCKRRLEKTLVFYNATTQKHKTMQYSYIFALY